VIFSLSSAIQIKTKNGTTLFSLDEKDSGLLECYAFSNGK
jgi:hypothetical protein